MSTRYYSKRATGLYMWDELAAPSTDPRHEQSKAEECVITHIGYFPTEKPKGDMTQFCIQMMATTDGALQQSHISQMTVVKAPADLLLTMINLNEWNFHELDAP